MTKAAQIMNKIILQPMFLRFFCSKQTSYFNNLILKATFSDMIRNIVIRHGTVSLLNATILQNQFKRKNNVLWAKMQNNSFEMHLS